MDTRTTPFGEHPDGGKIVDIKEGESVPEHMMPVSDEARKILDRIPMVSRVDFILNSTIPALAAEKEYLLKKLKKEDPATYTKYEYARCMKDFNYWFNKYYKVVNG